ncbi:MAG TPA: helicase-related protein [Thermoplasmata archaeon]|nr:helicase-related protein [Thermoplasmata archaeon]
MADTVVHPRIRAGVLEDRLYQGNIAQSAVARNTLVVLPTGLGKTTIALRTMAETWDRAPTRSLLFLAPTRPLVVQHARSIEAALVGPEPVVLTGTIPPARRAALVNPPQVIVATPQVIANDLAQGGLRLDPFALIVFDEAHRAVGEYPYVAIAEANREGPRARVLAMTASPGSQLERVREVWANLGIEHFELRTAEDPDVRPYVHDIGVEVREVPVPAELQQLAVLLRAAVRRQTEQLRAFGLLGATEATRRELLAVGATIHGQIEGYRSRGENVPPRLWTVNTAHAAAMKGLHALELAESQSVDGLRKFLDEQGEPKRGRVSPAQRAFVGDPDVVRTRAALGSTELEHPKVAMTVEIVSQELHAAPLSRVLVFAQFRRTAEQLVGELALLRDPAVRPARFVGQASRGADVGMTQKEQVELLDRFRSGAVNCLVATSVGEEGLDVPSTDLVIFYEPVPDVIRTIQRRGRTGRFRAGRTIVLQAPGRDVVLQRASRARERKMVEILDRVEEESRKGSLRPAARRTVQQQLPG